MANVTIKAEIKSCFNTEDGSGRAAIGSGLDDYLLLAHVSIPRTVAGGLQYYGSRRSWTVASCCFNTEDGSGRAAILCP